MSGTRWRGTTRGLASAEALLATWLGPRGALSQVPLRLCPITQRLPEMSESCPRISSWFLLSSLCGHALLFA